MSAPRGVTVVALSLAFACIVLAALVGWHSATYAVGIAYFLYGWMLYAIIGTIAVAISLFGVGARKGIALAIGVAVLVVVGGPASCTGSLLLRGYCEHKHTTSQGVVESSSCF